jgi:hypothetical protein
MEEKKDSRSGNRQPSPRLADIVNMSASFSLNSRASISMEENPISLDKKMKDMKERFLKLQVLEDIEGKQDEGTPTSAIELGNVINTTTSISDNRRSSLASPEAAKAMWGKLRKVVRTSSDINASSSNLSTQSVDSPNHAALTKTDQEEFDDSPAKEEKGSGFPVARSKPGTRPSSATSTSADKTLELEDIQLSNLWKKDELYLPYSHEGKVAKPELILPPVAPDLEKTFEEEVQPVKLEISRVPEEAVQEKKETIEKALLSQHRVNVETVKKLQTDIIWREDLGRKRVLELETKAKNKIRVERTKTIESALEREKKMGEQFRKAREELEEGIRRQEAAVREHFGKVLVHNESLARRFFVFTKNFPQPIEVGSL